MKLCECGCGVPIVQPRGGSRPKRFATGACRARWNRNHGKGAGRSSTPVSSPAAGDDEYQAKLRELYERLSSDVDTYGTLIETDRGPKANPSAAQLRLVIIELRRAATVPPVAEEVSDPNDLRAVLRSIG